MPPADRYTIRLPVLRTLGAESPTLVLPSSPSSWRRGTEALAYFFKREFGYDFPQFEAADGPADPDHVPYEAWLFHETAWDHIREVGEDPRRVLGAACFRRREYARAPARWTLDWAWFHAYERRRGHLSTSWVMLRERYGLFPAEPPLSDAMRAFLQKHSSELFESQP